MRRAALVIGLIAAGGALAASRPAVEAEHALVVSEQRLASEAGIEVLRQGGNAVDAAVAVGYALAVTHPCCGNIGGGGFMLIHFKDGTEKFIDFREMAPQAANKDMYLDANGNAVREASIHGWKAVAIPGTVAGFELALQDFGRLGRAKVMAPAIKLAKDGFTLVRGDTDIIDVGARVFGADPAARRIFLRPDGSNWQPGDKLVQGDLAKSLELISRQGAKGFYEGPVAQALADAMAKNGGILTLADLKAYKPMLREPLHCSYRGVEVSTAPPASSGGVGLCEMLNVLSGFDLAAMGFHSAQATHVMAETMRNVFRDRNALLGDPAFVDNPIARLLAPEYAEEIRGRIQPDKATPSEQLAQGRVGEKAETTHYSVVDGEGNAVAVTFTLNGLMGAAVMAPGTGFLLNDEMDDFTSKVGTANMFGLVQGEPNAIAPLKRPLSSMTPTIVSKNGKVFLVLGSPGGARISTIVLQSVLNIVDYDMKPQEAVDAPRFHHQFQPDRIFSEGRGFSADTLKILKEMGYTVQEQRNWGATGLIERAPDRVEAAGGQQVSDQALSGGLRPGWLYGASDPRRPSGAAVGY
jgi:gamma-glutamyltranspeptidase/glutathione hydrolase